MQKLITMPSFSSINPGYCIALKAYHGLFFCKGQGYLDHWKPPCHFLQLLLWSPLFPTYLRLSKTHFWYGLHLFFAISQSPKIWTNHRA